MAKKKNKDIRISRLSFKESKKVERQTERENLKNERLFEEGLRGEKNA